jgi:hypothetical protein
LNKADVGPIGTLSAEVPIKNSGRLYAFGKTGSFFIIVIRKNSKQVRLEENQRESFERASERRGG